MALSEKQCIRSSHVAKWLDLRYFNWLILPSKPTYIKEKVIHACWITSVLQDA